LAAAIPDKSSHSLKQVTLVWKSTGISDLANAWASAVAQQEVVGNDIKIKGHGTPHFGNGVANFVWEGNVKVTPKDAGAWHAAEQATFS
jgi:hypothetical protein